MFDILKIQKKKIVSNAVNLMPRYRSDISYNWTTTFDGSGNRQLINAGESNPDYKATLYSGRGVRFNGVDQSYKIDVTQGQALYKFDVTNNSLVTENITFTGVYELGKVGGAGDYEDVIYNNVIVSNTAFTDSELDYLHSHPEKFLYHEKQTDGTFVAKSKILTQDKIDSVVAHFPMCETDGFVRNMIGYSERPFNTNTGINGFSDTTEYHGVVADLTIESGSIRATDNSDNTNSPRIVLTNKTKPNTSYRLKYSLTVDESVHNLNYIQVVHSADWNNNGGIAVVNGGLGQTTGELVFTTLDDIDNQYCGITVMYDGDNDSNGAFWDLHYFELQELTSTYPIENFTNAARDDAKNLTTGLQTCFWKRDVLGVPTGIIREGIILPIDSSLPLKTGYVIDDANSFGVEAVLEVFSPRRYNYFNPYPFYFITHSAIDIYLRMNDVNVAVTTGVGKFHCYVEYDAASSIVTMSINGVVKNTGTVTKYGTYGELKTVYSNNGELPLFNIHTTPQDPAKLYADAVKKGLVPEQTQST